MLAPDEIKLFSYPVEEFEKYGVFDEDGHIIGVKNNASLDFKKDFADYQNYCAKCEVEGID